MYFSSYNLNHPNTYLPPFYMMSTFLQSISKSNFSCFMSSLRFSKWEAIYVETDEILLQSYASHSFVKRHFMSFWCQQKSETKGQVKIYLS